MNRKSILLLAGTSLAASACGNDVTGGGTGSGSGTDAGSQDELDKILASRTTDHGAALRIAALRLLGDLPTMTEINSIAHAPDYASKQAAYRALITDFLGRPAFARQMFLFWRDTFKTGGSPALDTAAAFAAKLAVDNASYLDLFTRPSANCPTFDPMTSTLSDAECTNGGPRAGVLTNPGLMAQFFSSLAFRRVRFIQETFACAPFPAEATGAPVEVGGSAPYTGAWPFSTIASPRNGGGRIDFQDVSSSLCAVCHGTLNHQAPLFAHYDLTGAYSEAISVPAPLDGAPPAELTDWLVPGDTTAWRYPTPAPDIPAFGAAMAQDPQVAACGVARLWNWALGKADIVDTLQEVPAATIQAQVDAFTGNGYKLKDLVFAVFTSEDFVKF